MSRYKAILIVVTGLLVFLSACGPSQDELDATVSGAAVNSRSTQTPTSPPTTSVPTPSITPTVSPTPFGGGGYILFASNREGNYQIYAITASDENIRRITNNDVNNNYPSISMNGLAIFFWSLDLTANPPLSEFRFIPNSPGAQDQLLFPNVTGSNMHFSPNGEKLIWETYSSPENADIIVAGFDANDPPNSLTSDPGQNTNPAWSPDGNTIAFSTNREGESTIYLMDVEGSNQRRLYIEDLDGVQPAWSPDGNKIAFAAKLDTTQIYIVNRDGSNLYALTNKGGINNSPFWSPDGKLIVYQSDRTGARQLYIINVETGEETRLTNNGFYDESPYWYWQQ